MGSAFPVGREYAQTLTGSLSSSQYIRSTKWQASPRIAPPMAGSAIQYAPEMPGELMRHWITAGAPRPPRNALPPPEERGEAAGGAPGGWGARPFPPPHHFPAFFGG